MVIYNGEDWYITKNDTFYVLMPQNCVQNNGMHIELPLDTQFEFAMDSQAYFTLIRWMK